MSDFKIIGNPDPTVGKEEFYSVNSFLPTVLPFQNPVSNNSFEQPVKWEIYILENGRWRKTKENDKTGKKVSYTFLQKSLDRKGIRILARRGEDVGRLNIKTHPAEAPKIEKIELLDKNGKKPSKPLSYGQTLKARVHCLHMEKRKVFVTLWEDDANGPGHNKANEKNIIRTLSGIVKNGKADVDFVLMPSFAKTAKQDGAEDKIHEYYVTTDFNKEKLASNNVNVNDLETPVAPYKKKVPVQQSIPQNTPAKKPVQTKSNTPTSSGSAAKEKAEITRVHLTDTSGRAISGVFKEKQIKVWIDSKGLIGKEIRLKLFDEDDVSNDLLFDQKFTIQSNIYSVVVPLNEIPRSKGGDNWFEGPQQEVFAHVEVIGTNKNKPSEIVQVDVKVFKPDPVEVTNKVSTVDKDADKKDGKKDKEKVVCQNCIDAVTADHLKHIFTKASPAVLVKVAKTYTDHMEELGMNTCWNKAHFFAQAVVESGENLLVSGEGEGMNYLAEELHLGRWNKKKTKRDIIFSYFANHKEEAYKYGRIEEIKNGKKIITQYANKEMIANLAYGPNSAKGKELGNTESSDGWNFRGKGLVQLTGRAGYEYANTYTKKEGADILQNPDLVVKDPAIAVLSSMAFFKWKKITSKTNGKTDTQPICKLVGKNVNLANGKSNYEEKQEAFTNKTSVEFETSKCQYGKGENITDLKIPQGITWLEGIQIDQNLADEKANYKVLYSQDGDRVTKKGEDVMDCSELVCRYLQKIEWSSKIKDMNTSALYDFAKKHPKWLEKHDSTDYIPKKGDIFIWKNDAGSNGHTGVVVNFDTIKDVVTTIEAIHFPEQPFGASKAIDLQGVVKLKWKRLSKHLVNHPVKTKRYTASTCRFYTPKIHYSKEDKK